MIMKKILYNLKLVEVLGVKTSSGEVNYEGIKKR